LPHEGKTTGAILTLDKYDWLKAQ